MERARSRAKTLEGFLPGAGLSFLAMPSVPAFGLPHPTFKRLLHNYLGIVGHEARRDLSEGKWLFFLKLPPLFLFIVVARDIRIAVPVFDTVLGMHSFKFILQ